MTLVRLVWAASAVLFFGVGVGVIWLPASRQIAMLRTSAAYADDDAYRNEQVARHAREILHARTRIVAELKRLSLGGSEGTLASRSLAMFYRVSAESGVEIRSVAPFGGDGKAGGSAAEPIPTGSWTLSVRGRYRNVLGFVRDLSRREVLTQVRDVTLAAGSTGTATPALDGMIDVSVYQIPSDEDVEQKHATGHR